MKNFYLTPETFSRLCSSFALPEGSPTNIKILKKSKILMSHILQENDYMVSAYKAYKVRWYLKSSSRYEANWCLGPGENRPVQRSMVSYKT